MRIIRTRDYKELSSAAADVIASQIIAKPDSVLGLATGTSPIGIYDELAERYDKGELDFGWVKSVNLDEYMGLSADNENSYRHFMNTHLFDRINIDKVNTHIPDGMTKDPAKEAASYDRMIQSLGGIDLQLLGIGRNGHIGFNEPSDHFEKCTHEVRLTESTIEANSRLFKSLSDVPTHAITMGIGAIMMARRILLIASGPDKAGILKEALFGNITPKVPASILQLHPDLIVVGDKEALPDVGSDDTYLRFTEKTA
ncbi:MAG: glucosamine-6-phosphate deaminase [Lachnospiraceae bacterium]|nr:glucosamine-6-phosphate deaminase [Lachnospiraceae bacterium]